MFSPIYIYLDYRGELDKDIQSFRKDFYFFLTRSRGVINLEAHLIYLLVPGFHRGIIQLPYPSNIPDGKLRISTFLGVIFFSFH